MAHHKTLMSIVLILPLAACFLFAVVSGGWERKLDNCSSDGKGEPCVKVAAAPASDASRSPETRGESMRVLWTVSGYVIGKSSAWDESKAKTLLFKPLDVDEGKITFDGKACNGVTFRRESVDAAGYLSRNWQTTPQALGIDEQELQVFRTDCDLPGFQQYVRLRDGRLIVLIHGVFFFFEPAVTR